MPLPRLSATLNNCALHALTPELKDEIAQIAANRELSLHIAPAYQLLKNQFALFYGLEELTFHDFNRILQGYNDFKVDL